MTDRRAVRRPVERVRRQRDRTYFGGGAVQPKPTQ
jgi:hypothetical protein